MKTQRHQCLMCGKATAFKTGDKKGNLPMFKCSDCSAEFSASLDTQTATAQRHNFPTHIRCIACTSRATFSFVDVDGDPWYDCNDWARCDRNFYVSQHDIHEWVRRYPQ